MQPHELGHGDVGKARERMRIAEAALEQAQKIRKSERVLYALRENVRKAEEWGDQAMREAAEQEIETSNSLVPADGLLQVDWSSMPSWVNWVAADIDGEVYFYEAQPLAEKGKWIPGDKGRSERVTAAYASYINAVRFPHWRLMIVGRPEWAGR